MSFALGVLDDYYPRVPSNRLLSRMTGLVGMYSSLEEMWFWGGSSDACGFVGRKSCRGTNANGSDIVDACNIELRLYIKLRHDYA